MNARHVQLIALYSVRYSVRSGIGLVFLLISLVFGLMVARAFLQPTEMLVRQQRAQGIETTASEVLDEVKDQRVIRGAIGWLLGSSSIEKIENKAERQEAQKDIDLWTEHLLDDHPALLSAILLILLFGWPFVTSLGAFNIFSGDVESRGIRYHLMRTDRSSIFFGRVLGMILSQALVLLLLMLAIIGYMGLKLPLYGWGPLLLWGGLGTAMLIVVSVPYIALCAWVSAAIDSAVGSLTVITLIIGGIPLIALFGSSLTGSFEFEQIKLVNFLLPWGAQNYLHHHSPAIGLGTAALCLAYAAVYLYLGHRHFTRRDL